MRYYAEKREAALGEWHSWFAWRPVWCKNSGAIVWLEYVCRRGAWEKSYDPCWRWEYQSVGA